MACGLPKKRLIISKGTNVPQSLIHQEKILIVDFGSQTTQLIARRVREIGVYCEIVSYKNCLEKLSDFSPNGIILSGGPNSVHFSKTPRVPLEVFSQSVPVLGICYGMQAMAAAFGGEVVPSAHREFGFARVETVAGSQLFADLYDEKDNDTAYLHAWMSHCDVVKTLPKGFLSVGHSKENQIAAIEDKTRGLYAVQFHPEVTHTAQGFAILSRFVKTICQCKALWTMGNIIEESIVAIREKVGKDHVILGLSGGVDSAVVACLLQRAIGEQLHCVFVDNGLLRLNEAEHVMEQFSTQHGLNILKVDAGKQFLTALKGVVDPEEKRKIIGKIFIEVFESAAKKLPKVKWLAQGTIYSDVIESANSAEGNAHLIKSHHNVGGLPEKMDLALLEPIRELFKDEVRRLGVTLGLSEGEVNRHPFPGPGLGVRVMGEIKEEFLVILRQADSIFMEELVKSEFYSTVSQAFAIFLPVKSVGVVGDARQYAYVIALRAVETIDFMTARWAHLPPEFLSQVSSRIINEVPDVSRVVYDISDKPPATIEWE
jgi:GMP synthase (glutamine-hydrolysing)